MGTSQKVYGHLAEGINCVQAKKKQIELMELDRSGIHVAEYLTVLPDEKLLQEKLQRAIKAAQERFDKSEREDGQRL